MVSLELLSSLDGLLWLQSGTKVGTLFQQHQTTVSRNQKKCSRVFDITLFKQNKKWVVNGDQTLLQLERKVHQTARLQGKSRLRIEVNEWIKNSHFNPPPMGWIVGSTDNVDDPYSIQCLKKHIIDACLCPISYIPAESQEFSIIPINARIEVGLAVLKQHANQERVLELINILKSE